MADLFVVEELKDFLIAQGICVAPTAKDSAPTVLPTIWLQPRDGAPQPRFSDANEQWQEDATITLVDTQTGGPAQWTEAYLEETFVEVIVRSRNAAAGKLIHRQVRGLIHPIGALGGRKLWTMSDLLVELSIISRSEQPVGSTPVDYTRAATYMFACRRKALAGLPYAP